jgi:ATP-binding cassette, subfamily B (MDR/TAP), member 1
MTLLFGNLTLAFVNFGKALEQALQNNNASSAEAIRDAGDAFKRAAAKDGIYLVCIGKKLISSFTLCLDVNI